MFNLNGIPAEISLYHPIEFLELKKGTVAFLDLNLVEIKGGVTCQLLVGHLVYFIQNYGLEALEQFPRCRKDYIDELVESLKNKGLEVSSLNKKWNINWDRANKLSSDKLIYQPNDSFDQQANLFSTSNYRIFRKFDFNRKVNRRHVRELIGSIKRNKRISYPLIIYTNIVDGSWGYYIVDGQHRCEAFEALGMPIWFTLYQKEGDEPITMYDLVRLVADVNNTSKPWGVKEYLWAWKSLGIREYKKIYEENRQYSLPINILLQAYSGLNRTKAIILFNEGNYRMLDEENGSVYVQNLVKLKSVLNTRETIFLSSMLDFFREVGDRYDNEKMIAVLKKAKDFNFGSKTDEVKENIKIIYNEW